MVLADQKTGQVKASVPLPDLTSVSVSTQSDGFFALRLKEVREARCEEGTKPRFVVIQF